MDNSDSTKDVWVIVTAGNTRVLGKVYSNEKSAFRDMLAAGPAMLMPPCISLKPCYDFFAPLRTFPVAGPDGRPHVDPNSGAPRIGVARDPIIMPRDFTVHPYPVHVLLGPGVMLDFLDDMQAQDKQLYMDFVDSVDKNLLERRAQSAGLTLPKKQ